MSALLSIKPKNMHGNNCVWLNQVCQKCEIFYSQFRMCTGIAAPEEGLPCKWLSWQCIEKASDNVIEKTSAERQGDHQDGEEDNRAEEKPKILYLPYVKGLSETIQRVDRRICEDSVQITWHTKGDPNEGKVKDTRGQQDRHHVPDPLPRLRIIVHKWNWRTLKKRITEHKAAGRRGDRNNGVAMHAWDHQHQVDTEGAKIIDSESHYMKGRVLEAIWIHNTRTNSNLDCGLSLNQIWTPFLSHQT